MVASVWNILIYAGIVLVAFLVIGIVLTRLYRRATKDVALIRTGFGGEKVVLNGGIMVIPVLHRPCAVPALLRSKKYADFSEDYSKGLEQLLFALDVSGPRASANSLILNRVSPPKQRMQRSGRNKADRSRHSPKSGR